MNNLTQAMKNQAKEFFTKTPQYFKNVSTVSHEEMVEMCNHRSFTLEPYLETNRLNVLEIDKKGRASFQTDFAQRTRNKIAQWQGKIFPKPKKREWRKYTFTEFIWMDVIEQLRAFGLSIKTLEAVYVQLMLPTPSTQQLETLFYELGKKYPIDKNDNTGAPVFTPNEFMCSKDNSTQLSYEACKQFQVEKKKLKPELDNMLSSLIADVIVKGENVFLLVFEGGNSVWTELEDELRMDKESSWLTDPHITIYLPSIISNYAISEMMEEEHFRNVVMTDEEYEVISEIRKGGLTSLNIRFDKKNAVELIESTKEYDTKELESKYIKHILGKNAYETITLQTQGGKTVSFRKTTKKKLN